MGGEVNGVAMVWVKWNELSASVWKPINIIANWIVRLLMLRLAFLIRFLDGKCFLFRFMGFVLELVDATDI